MPTRSATSPREVALEPVSANRSAAASSPRSAGDFIDRVLLHRPCYCGIQPLPRPPGSGRALRALQYNETPLSDQIVCPPPRWHDEPISACCRPRPAPLPPHPTDEDPH